MLHKWFDTDDGVMTPVMRLPQLPVLHTGGKQTSGYSSGKLLNTGMQCLHAAGTGRSLDNAGFRMRLHQAHQRGDGIAGHHAVGIEHHHISVIFSPAAAKIRHISCLALGATLAQTIVKAKALPQLFLQG